MDVHYIELYIFALDLYLNSLNHVTWKRLKVTACGRLPLSRYANTCVAANSPTIWASTHGLEPVVCNRLHIEPSGWAQTVHMFTQRFT